MAHGVYVVVTLLARRCIQRSALGTEHSSRHFRLSVRRCELWPQCGWIAMPFGVVSRVWLRRGVLDFGGDRRMGRGSLGVNLRRPIVTNGDFVASLCGSAYSDRAVVWHGEWGGPRHSCVTWKSTCLKGCFWRRFWHFLASAYALFQ